MTYNSSNIFAKILRGEVPCKKFYEDEYVLAFHDIAPKAPVHMLVIPKNAYVDFTDFAEKASTEEISHFFKTIKNIVKSLNLDSKGYRLISNCLEDGGQEVPHFHVHILGGNKLGKMIGD